MQMFLVCLMCFVAGGCLVTLVTVCAHRPNRRVLLGWLVYFTLILTLAWRLGGLMV